MPVSGGINSIIAKAVVLLHTDSLYGPRLSNCWLPAATWADTLSKSGHIDPTIVSIDARRFNTAMSKSNLFGESMLTWLLNKVQPVLKQTAFLLTKNLEINIWKLLEKYLLMNRIR